MTRTMKDMILGRYDKVMGKYGDLPRNYFISVLHCILNTPELAPWETEAPLDGGYKARAPVAPV